MKTIYLLSCCKQKLSYPAVAEKLYQSTGFKKSLRYAKSKNPDSIYILSAMHHVVPLDKILEYYNLCLSDESASEQKKWAKICLDELSQKFDLTKDKFVILAGKDYYKNLIGAGRIENYELPLEGLTQGYRLQWFDEHTVTFTNGNEECNSELLCDNIHEFVNGLKRYKYPFDSSELPENGIYVFFEKGETYKGKDRIVRVGTHTGQNNLRSRIEQHLCNENKDRSIFRKNIGKAILNKDNDSFLGQWNIDLTTKAAKEKYASKIDKEKMIEVEKQVTQYMRENLSFSVLPIDKKEERLQYEEFIIRSVSANKKCKPSENWLGNYSPEEKIRSSGMWLKQGLAK